MKKQPTTIENFMKEYSLEIASEPVEINDLLNLGITKDELAAEVKLRAKYGDHIYSPEGTEESVSEENKTIEKITDKDIARNKHLLDEFDKIDADEFNDVVEKILVKAAE